MVSARTSGWKFKQGQGEETLKTLESKISGEARGTRGYRGSLVLQSVEDPNAGTIITKWEDEKTLRESAAGVFKDAAREIKKFTAAPPDVKNHKIFGADLVLV